MADSTITCFGFRYLAVLLNLQGRSIEVVNLADDGYEALLDDLVAIVNYFCAKLYGQHRARRKTEQITEALKRDHEKDAVG